MYAPRVLSMHHMGAWRRLGQSRSHPQRMQVQAKGKYSEYCFWTIKGPRIWYSGIQVPSDKKEPECVMCGRGIVKMLQK